MTPPIIFAPHDGPWPSCGRCGLPFREVDSESVSWEERKVRDTFYVMCPGWHPRCHCWRLGTEEAVDQAIGVGGPRLHWWGR